MTEFFTQLLSANQFASGGIVIIILGAILAILRKVPEHIYKWFMRKITIKIDIQQADEAFGWMQLWLAKKGGTIRDISVYTKHCIEETDGFTKSTDNRPKFYFTPAPGQHLYWFHNRPMLVTRTRPNEGGLTKGIFNKIGGDSINDENLSIRIFSRDTTLPEKLISEARDVALPQNGRIDVRISVTKWSAYWILADRIRPRPIESVILPNNKTQELLTDIKEFLTSFEWYAKIGIPYRRGYLLYGPPGNGKTSIAVALASTLKMNVYVLSLAGQSMTDSKIGELLTSVSDNSIILMEDIDCAFIKREKKEDEEHLTFSGLLNALDGVSGKDGRIIFMTTNHVDKLDPALIRPGRIDVKYEIGNATRDQAITIFKRFHQDASHETAVKFANCLKTDKISMAALQGHLMNYKDKPTLAIHNFHEILDEITKVELYKNRLNGELVPS